MASIRSTLKARVADNELDSPTKQFSSGDRLRYLFHIDSMHQASRSDGSAPLHPHSTPESPLSYPYAQGDGIASRPYCNPASPLPFSVYNFIASQREGTVKSPSPTRTVGDTISLSTPHASLATQRDGQPLPKPSQPPPKPAPGPKPQNRDQGNLLCRTKPPLAPADDAYGNALQQQEHTGQEPPARVYFDACDSEWDRASSSESDSDSKSRCSVVCSCYSCYSDYSSPEGSISEDFFETATLASLDEACEAKGEGESSQGAVNGNPHCGSGDGQASDDADDADDAGSCLSACSGGWVDLAEPSQQHHRHRLHVKKENGQGLWSPSRGPESHSRSSPPPPPPPSSPRRR